MTHIEETSFWFMQFSEPIYVLTGDQDWAAEWALSIQVEAAAEAGVPLHIFSTNHSAVLTSKRQGLTMGIHPNFLPNSSHGSTPKRVVEHCKQLVPDSTTARCHAFAESTAALQALASAGITADSGFCSHLQPWLTPTRHFTGIIRLPVFLEDDVLMGLSSCRIPRLVDLEPHLVTPGLKIFNFHPAHVGLNSANLADYDRHRNDVTGSADIPMRLRPYGTRDLYLEVLEWLSGTDRIVLSFDQAVELCNQAIPHSD